MICLRKSLVVQLLTVLLTNTIIVFFFFQFADHMEHWVSYVKEYFEVTCCTCINFKILKELPLGGSKSICIELYWAGFGNICAVKKDFVNGAPCF